MTPSGRRPETRSAGRLPHRFPSLGRAARQRARPAPGRGAVALGSLHPLRAFTGAAGENWRGAFVAIEGDPTAVEAGLAVAAAFGAHGHRLDAAGKPLYHAGAQLAAGGTAAVVSLATRAWAEAGLDPESARRELAGLSASAAGAVAAGPFAEAFTGAVARRDVGTVRAHLEALASQTDSWRSMCGSPRRRWLELRATEERRRSGLCSPGAGPRNPPMLE